MWISEDEQFPTTAFVFVCDRSDSMKQSGALDQIDTFLPKMVTALRRHERFKESGLLSVIGFSRHSEVVLPLMSIAHHKGPLTSSITPSKTDFAPPFEEVRRQLSGVPAAGSRFAQPVVFFMSDGHHNVGDPDRWWAARAQLVHRSFAARPTVVALGMGATDQATLETIASAPDLVRYFDGDPIEAINAMLKLVLKTTIRLSEGKEGAAGGAEDDFVSRIQNFRYDDDSSRIVWRRR